MIDARGRTDFNQKHTQWLEAQRLVEDAERERDRAIRDMESPGVTPEIAGEAGKRAKESTSEIDRLKGARPPAEQAPPRQAPSAPGKLAPEAGAGLKEGASESDPELQRQKPETLKAIKEALKAGQKTDDIMETLIGAGLDPVIAANWIEEAQLEEPQEEEAQ